MYRQHETNPHFLPSQPSERQNQPRQSPPPPRHGSGLQSPSQPQAPRQGRRARQQGPDGLQSLAQSQPQQYNHDRPSQMHNPILITEQLQPGRHKKPSQTHGANQSPSQLQPDPHNQPSLTHDSNPHFPMSSTPQSHQAPMHLDQQHPHPSQQSSYRRGPRSYKTKPWTWCIAVLCALFWIIIILGGLIVLIIYLLFHPQSPKFDIAGASLNAVYLDMGYLLNADLNLLANFTNPNKKVNVDFKYAYIYLYYEGILIGTTFIDRFTLTRAQYMLTTVHIVTSQVELSRQHTETLRNQTEGGGGVRFEIKGMFRTRSNLGSFLKYSYWLYGHCYIIMSGPPDGVMVKKDCRTKR